MTSRNVGKAPHVTTGQEDIDGGGVGGGGGVDSQGESAQFWCSQAALP